MIVKPKSLDDEDEAISDADQIDDPSASVNGGDQENGGGDTGVAVNNVADNDSAEDQDDDVFYDSDVIEQDEEWVMIYYTIFCFRE